MTRPRSYQTEAVIIKKTKLGEADSILTLYTLDIGKTQAVARGVRRPKSKLAGHLELLTHSLVSFARGRNLDTIAGSQTINSFLALKSNLELASYALYALELVNQFTADHIENHPLFQLIVNALQQLEQSSDPELVLRHFELHLLDEVGYRPQLQHCVSCHRSLQPVINRFSPSMGGVLCTDCAVSHPYARSLSLNALKVLRLMQGSEHSVLNRLRLDAGLQQELETVMRGYIRYLLERDVKSTAWLDSLREQRDSIVT
jgi:DNA repair protein RecO (recombination protein O)